MSVWVGNGGVSEFRGRTEVFSSTPSDGPLPHVALTFFLGGLLLGTWEGGMNTEVKNGESDE